ncbi:putative vesicle transport v-SNARE protein Gos1 [Pseudovirgaria hyperparasitica]|uniref:Golgi SNAP receptor complex member 1 n=1 Tax=Pseudovirgaria hyperparasitica TaxID=470096 RepID=A0A6A6WHJ8_9PEZI|nr:putative vesicle transport v-SNARE protein Gos1 [Pseudovirgaria hyperparasitica]KAF2761554.1 putative vesicle transport v-SNARE protein Gos1 [Pseudovirgaria hyperparasitica]
MSSTGGGWAQLRQQARSLETQTESLFHTYSQYASMSNISQKPSEEETRTEAQLIEILDKREALLSQLTRLLDSESSQSALKQNNLSRHREILQDHRRELSRLKSTINSARDRANLLSNVRSDIDAYRSSNPGAAEAEYMLDERRRIDNSNNMADSILAQAYAANESFASQRETLMNVNRRITASLSTVPGINSLIGRIGAKKRRDGIILGSFISFCFLMLLYFW